MWNDIKRIILFYFLILVCMAPAAWFKNDIGIWAEVSFYIGFFILIIIFRVLTGVRIIPLLSLNKQHKNRKRLVGYMALIFPLLCLNLLWVYLILKLIGIDISDLPKEVLEPDYGMLWAVIGTCVLPALLEETAFRGIIQTTLRRALGPRDAIIITSIMFEIIHLRIILFPFLLTSVYLSILRHKFNSLLPGIITHFTYNLMVVLVFLLLRNTIS